MSPNTEESSKVSPGYAGMSYKAVTTGKSKLASDSGGRKSAVYKVGKGKKEDWEEGEKVASSGNAQRKHSVLTEEELATFRTSFCTKHHQNKCPNSDSCEKSHCLTWQRRNPYEINYCPHLCPEIQFVKKSRKMVLYRRCTRGKNCNFAHSKEEELYHPLVYKTKQCSAYPKCSRYFCPFVHNPSELRDISQLKNLTIMTQDDRNIGVNRLPTIHQDDQGSQHFTETELVDTIKDNANGLWYELPSISAMCGYDDVAFKNLYGNDYGSFAQVPTEEYAPEFDLQNCVAWQTLSPNQFDTQLIDNRFNQQFDDNFNGQFVQFVENGLEEQFNTLSINKHDEHDDYSLNDILVKFMNEIGDK